MEFLNTDIEGLKIIKPKVFVDPRGYFFESYNKQQFDQNGIDVNFVQDNESLSEKGVLRGLHFQKPPYAQGKLVKVIKGAVLDVVVDIRKASPTYGQHFSIELTEENKIQFWVPPGFAHGFLTSENNTIFQYKCTQFYNKDSEDAILWNDSTLNINWRIINPKISEKDKEAKSFNKLVSLF